MTQSFLDKSLGLLRKREILWRRFGAKNSFGASFPLAILTFFLQFWSVAGHCLKKCFIAKKAEISML